MSVVTLDNASKLDTASLHALAASAGLKLNESHVDDWATLLGTLDQSIEAILAQEDYTLTPDLSLYPRTNIHIPAPEDSDQGGWATKCFARSTSPKSDLLQGKTVALKDNIALAGVRCTNGTRARDWTPGVDAVVAKRVMDAGGTVKGKAACESACMEGVSDTSCTGKVLNFWAEGYSCGGSSSGSGRLVASGEVDLAVGCDQGGSIRIPASMCGIVGLKPTWGLVPYTGILSLEATIDHAGPMAKTVFDTALLLQAIAGPDGIDDRQPPFLPPGTLDYTSPLRLLPSISLPLAGMKIGHLLEGFTIPGMTPSISTLTSRAIEVFTSLGATVHEVSIPAHTSCSIIWMCGLPLSGARTGLLGDMDGRKQLYMLDREPLSSLSQPAFDALGPGAQNLYMRYLYLKQKYGPKLHAKCANLIRQINDAYDRALGEVDVLVMPTLPSPPCRLFVGDPASKGPLERLSRNVGLVGNTAPFNSTGHPALTIPVGFVPALEDETVKLPTGMQIVGRKFGDGECLKVGAAWEGRVDWKTF